MSVSRSFAIAVLTCAALLLGVAAIAHAQNRPVATASVKATLGNYRADLDDWEVLVEWRVECSEPGRFAWTVYLRGKPAGEFITANGSSPVGTGSRLVHVQNKGQPYTVTPFIEARCFAGNDESSDFVEAYGASLTIPSWKNGEVDDGSGGDGPGNDGRGDGREPGDGNGNGGFGGGGTSVLIPAHCRRNTISGTPADDVLNGTSGHDLVLGYEGDDRLSGSGGRDCLLGHDGEDRLAGGPAADLLDGGFRADALRGGPGDDRLHGGPGRDRLAAGGGENRLVGGRGNDRLSARNGNPDVVSCGAGRRDFARVDRLDVVRRCERVDAP